MGTGHHGGHHQPNPELDALMKRFIEQAEGTSKREYPSGRLSPDDDGTLAMAITADQKTGTVILNFGKPVVWIGFKPSDAVGLAKLLIEKAREVSREPLVLDLGG